ncbi:MAG: FumA C-terminus/TtdB family hydratase beta subunit [Turicibacter sp.]|nr:FumA C-terminus/TtdB family hydratase beta subunit [Turicibacter sp.]
MDGNSIVKGFTTPFTEEMIQSLKAGDIIELTGTIYSARDAAHARMAQAIADGVAAPFEYAGETVFYAGPCPAPPGKPIGSVGPTTASRMDAYSPLLIEHGLKIMIGKGNRSSAVLDAVVKYKGLYLVAVGGVATLMAKRILKSEIIAYEDLGTEAIRRLTVEKFPLAVAIDSYGGVL